MEDLTSLIENAIQDIYSVKQQLQQNTTEVKSQIQTNISRHLEALRNREVWLLNQVELLQNAKEEVLHQQQTKLNKQLGVLQSKLSTSLEALQLDVSDLKPEESPYMTFRSDSASLRESINTYGKVDTNGIPHAVFVKPGDPSTSLPRHFEEYEDAEHHVLYKTLEEVKRNQTGNSCIEFRFPKLSPRREDWLAKPSTTTASFESAPKFTIPTFSEPTSKWLMQSGDTHMATADTSTMVTTGSVCSTTSSSVTTIMSEGLSSISSSHSVPSFKPYTTNPSTQNWLKQIKNDYEDEEDFEIVEKAGSVDDDTDHQDGFLLPFSHSSPDLASMDRNPKIQSNNIWLTSKSSNTKETNDFDVFKQYYINLSKDKSSWLHVKPPLQEKCKEKCQNKPSMDIENLGSLMLDSEQGSCPSDNIWLKVDDVGEKELTWLCSASEKCSDMSACSNQPNCLDVYIEKAKEKSCCQTTHHCPGFKKFQGKVDKQTWLINGDKKISSTMPVEGDGVFRNYFQNATKGLSDWIKRESLTNESHSSKEVSFNHIEKQSSAWLKIDSTVVSSTPLYDMPGWKYDGSKEQEEWLQMEGNKGLSKQDSTWEFKSCTDLQVWLHDSRRNEDNRIFDSGISKMSHVKVKDKDMGGYNKKWLQPRVIPGTSTDVTTKGKNLATAMENSQWLMQ